MAPTFVSPLLRLNLHEDDVTVYSMFRSLFLGLIFSVKCHLSFLFWRVIFIWLRVDIRGSLNLGKMDNTPSYLKILSGEEGANNHGGILDLVENLLTVGTDEEGSAILVPILKVLSKELEEIDEANELFG